MGQTRIGRFSPAHCCEGQEMKKPPHRGAQLSEPGPKRGRAERPNCPGSSWQHREGLELRLSSCSRIPSSRFSNGSGVPWIAVRTINRSRCQLQGRWVCDRSIAVILSATRHPSSGSKQAEAILGGGALVDRHREVPRHGLAWSRWAVALNEGRIRKSQGYEAIHCEADADLVRWCRNRHHLVEAHSLGTKHAIL